MLCVSNMESDEVRYQERIAQLVEHRTDNTGVAGSIPALGTETEEQHGALVQREDVCFASRKSGFDSPVLHSPSRNAEVGQRRAACLRNKCLRVRLPPSVLNMLWYANRQSGEFQTFVFEGSTPSRSTSIQTQPSGGTGRHATLRMSCPHAACEFNSRLGYFDDQPCRCDRCPTDSHEVGVLGSIPRPATEYKQHRGWASAQPGLISQDRRVRPPDPLLRWSSTQTGKAASMRGL